MNKKIIISNNNYPSMDEQKELCLELRKNTDHNLLDCRNALLETNWNIENAKLNLEQYLKNIQK